MESILKDSFNPTESLSMVDLLEADRDNQMQAQHLSKACGKNLNECRYSKGYINQPVFACLTCYNASNNNSNNSNNKTVQEIDYSLLSGFCLGCSMNCHLDHNIIELWNKREFKCDCGNKKFINSIQSQCLLSCKKDEINVLNKYNHNFIGKYCYCNREYSSSQHTMHQCLNCQDWFHQTCIILNHLKINPYLKEKYDLKKTNNNDQKQDDDNNDDAFFEYFRKLLIPQSEDEENCFDSFICKECAIKYDYLFVPYRWKMKTIQLPSNNKLTGIKRNFSEMSKDLDLIHSNDDNMENKRKRRKLNEDENNNDNKTEISTKCQRILLNEDELNNISSIIGGGLWFSTNWIHKLCECDNCKQEIYDKYKLKWLFQTDDMNENNDDNDDNNNNDQESNIYNLNVNESQELSREFSTDAMIADEIKKMPRQKTLDALNLMLKGTDIIKQKLVEYIKLNPTKKIIDQNDIHNIFKT